MYCPECGFDAGEAKFCPECGTKLDQVREAVRGAGAAKGARTTGAARGAAGQGAAAAAASAVGDTTEAAPRGGPRPAKSGTNPMYVWIVIAVVAVVAVGAWYLVRGGGGSSSSGSSSGTPVTANTTGTYDQLVQRANAHYDQGNPFAQKGDFTSAQPYFLAAAKEYAAAWAQRATDPNVASDYSVALFYAGDPNGALSIVNKALALKPKGDTLQTALYNKGNYLAMIGRGEVQSGKTAAGKADLAQAKAAYKASIAVAKSTAIGQAAKQALAGLSQIAPSSASPAAGQ